MKNPQSLIRLAGFFDFLKGDLKTIICEALALEIFIHSNFIQTIAQSRYNTQAVRFIKNVPKALPGSSAPAIPSGKPIG